MHNDVRYPVFRYTLTLEDYRHFHFYHNRRLAVLWLLLLFALFVGTAIIAGPESRSIAETASVGIYFCCLFGVLMWAVYRWQTRRSFRANPFIRQEQAIECGPAGLRVITSSSDLTIQWKEISQAIEFPRQFALYISEGQGVVIPKMHVEPAAFRRLLVHYIPHNRIKLIAR
ncbi:YcxB family protein [Paenibacillus xylaniclasticus]|uniref:YcxB family protein n=1 Tax=Paenibacillus xylaniclasticus TaxID=588083 RepID=UPI000FDA8D45|nr:MULTISPECIES: YcxB family protein [Paenibacillus]GFN30833.1 hypothetical protein PCURB6_10930 [Paenibacillus curdlanolyticus]